MSCPFMDTWTVSVGAGSVGFFCPAGNYMGDLLYNCLLGCGFVFYDFFLYVFYISQQKRLRYNSEEDSEKLKCI